MYIFFSRVITIKTGSLTQTRACSCVLSLGTCSNSSLLVERPFFLDRNRNSMYVRLNIAYTNYKDFSWFSATLTSCYETNPLAHKTSCNMSGRLLVIGDRSLFDIAVSDCARPPLWRHRRSWNGLKLCARAVGVTVQHSSVGVQFDAWCCPD